MNAIWKALLTQTAQTKFELDNIKNDELSHVIPLENFSCITVASDKATDFLQGQFSNDVMQLGNQCWQFSCYCDHKGRVIAFFWLYKFDKANYTLCLPSDAAELCLAELKKFAVFSKVEVKMDESLRCIATLGKQKLETGFDFFMSYQGLCIEQNLYIFNHERIPENLLSKPLASNQFWQYACIENQLPMIGKAQQHLFTPHHLGLNKEPHIAIHYKKGCYRGQEIIARMHYLGKLKQQLVKVIIDNVDFKLDGLLSNNSDEKVAELVNYLKIKENQYLALAIMNNSMIEKAKTAIIPLKNQATLRVIE